MSRFVLIGLIGLLVSGGTTGAVAMEQQQLSRKLGSGQEQRVANHYRFDDSCVGIVPSIIVKSPPRSGSIRHERVDITLTDKMANARCVGKVIKGVNVYYKSVDGFTGTDSFVYERITNDRFDTAYTVTVEVQ